MSVNGHTKPPNDLSSGILAHALEVTGAQRDSALASLLEVVKVLNRIGGYMDAPDRHALDRAVALLEENGAITKPRTITWRNRG